MVVSRVLACECECECECEGEGEGEGEGENFESGDILISSSDRRMCPLDNILIFEICTLLVPTVTLPRRSALGRVEKIIINIPVS